jgi:hypothetical protein
MKFMHDIDEKVSFINYCLESLCDNLEQETIDLLKTKDELSSILDDMMALNDDIIHLSQKFNYPDDYWSINYLFRAFDKANEAYTLLQGMPEAGLQQDTLEHVFAGIKASYYLWNEKFIDDFECWCSGLMSTGLFLSKNIAVYDLDSTDEAFLQMVESALRAESLYFALDRNKSQITLAKTKDDLIFNRRTKSSTRPIQTQQMSGRSLISANVASMTECTQGVLAERLANIELAAIDCQWNRTGRINWNRQITIRGAIETRTSSKPIEIHEQFQPIAGQLANMHTKGVGRYGDGKSGRTPNILALLDSLTGGIPKNEIALASLLLRYKRGDGSALGETALRGVGINLPENKGKRDTLIKQFNKAAYLVCFQEVYRRKNQGYRKTGEILERVVELPFGLAVGCLLKLLTDGHLRFRDIFDKDSEYGVFTATGVMSTDIINTIKKFNTLFSFFIQRYAMQEYCVFEYSNKMEEFNVSFTPQYFHTILRQTDGGESDSDNEDYEISPDRTGNTQEIKRLISNLSLRTSTAEL